MMSKWIYERTNDLRNKVAKYRSSYTCTCTYINFIDLGRTKHTSEKLGRRDIMTRDGALKKFPQPQHKFPNERTNACIGKPVARRAWLLSSVADCATSPTSDELASELFKRIRPREREMRRKRTSIEHAHTHKFLSARVCTRALRRASERASKWKRKGLFFDG